MSTTGLVIGTAQSTDTLASTTWSNAANILVNDDTEATEAIVAKNTPGTGSSTTGWIKVGTFGFDSLIPSGANITNVSISVRWRMNSAGGIGNRDMCWALSGTRDTNTHSLSTEPTTLETTVTDVTSERSWTRANLLNGTFEVHARGRNGNSTTDPSYRFAWIKVEVQYAPEITGTGGVTAPAPALAGSGTVATLVALQVDLVEGTTVRATWTERVDRMENVFQWLAFQIPARPNRVAYSLATRPALAAMLKRVNAVSRADLARRRISRGLAAR